MGESTTAAPRSRGAKILIGTAVGCGLILILGVGGCAGFMWWLNSPGDVIDPDRLRAGDSSTYVEWTLSLEDPATERLLETALGKLAEVQQAGVPDEGLGALFGNLQQMQQNRNEAGLRKLLPLVVAATSSPAGDGQDAFVISASARGADHQIVLLDWIVSFVARRSRATETVRHEGETIIVIEPDSGERFGLFIRGGDVFWATSVEEAQRTVDRLVGKAEFATGNAPVDDWLLASAERPLRGGLDNSRGEVRRIWDMLLQTPSDEVFPGSGWDAIEGLFLAGGVAEGNAFDIEITVDLVDAAAAAAAVEPLRAGLERELEGAALNLDGVTASGDRLWIVLRSDDLIEAIEGIGSGSD